MTTIKASELRPGDVIRSGECDGWRVGEAQVFPLPHTPDWRLFSVLAHRILLTLERENDYFASGTPADFDPIETRTAWLHADDTVEIESAE